MDEGKNLQNFPLSRSEGMEEGGRRLGEGCDVQNRGLVCPNPEFTFHQASAAMVVGFMPASCASAMKLRTA
jgi:hypothetical protein